MKHGAETPASFEGVVEADETFVGGLEKNKHAPKKVGNRKRNGESIVGDGKTVVVGIRERETKRVFAQHLPRRDKGNVCAFVCDNTDENAVIYTDEWGGYKSLPRHHSYINHKSQRKGVREGYDQHQRHREPLGLLQAFLLVLRHIFIFVYEVIRQMARFTPTKEDHMAAKYVLKLAEEERQYLSEIAKGRRGKQAIAQWKVTRAKALLKCDQGELGPAWATGTSPTPWTSPNGPFRTGARERFWMDPRRPWSESCGARRRSRRKSMAGLKRTSRSWPARHRQRAAIAGRCDCWPRKSSNSNSSIRSRTKRSGGR